MAPYSFSMCMMAKLLCEEPKIKQIKEIQPTLKVRKRKAPYFYFYSVSKMTSMLS